MSFKLEVRMGHIVAQRVKKKSTIKIWPSRLERETVSPS